MTIPLLDQAKSDAMPNVTQPTETLRLRAWWRAVRRHHLTPAELSLIVLDGDQDRACGHPDQHDHADTNPKGKGYDL